MCVNKRCDNIVLYTMFRAVILGAPASGKGTISGRIVKHFDIAHVSSGDLLRNQIAIGKNIGKDVEEFLSQGKLVPDDVMTKLIFTKLELINSKNWLLDGYPRTRHQGEELLTKYPVQLAIALEVPVEVIIERVKGRWIHLPSGRVYNETFNAPKIPGKDDITGEDLIQRPDDTPEAVNQRLREYHKTVQPLITLYEERSILKKFTGRTSDEIWPKVRDVIDSYIGLSTPRMRSPS